MLLFLFAVLLETKYFRFITADKPRKRPAKKSVTAKFGNPKCKNWLKRIPNVKVIDPIVKATLSLSN
jgi:hypothetical protein